jgi:hypothetical protein
MEDATREVYEKAMVSEPSLPMPIRQLLARQAAHIEKVHVAVKEERDRLDQAA